MSMGADSAFAQVGQRGSSLQAQQEAERQQEYNNLVYEQTAHAATAAALEEFTALRQRSYEERAKTAQEIRQITSESRAAAGQARLQAMESGTGGRSLDLLLADFERSELQNADIAQQNLQFTEQQLQRQVREAIARRNDRIAAARRPDVYGPYNSNLGIAGTFLPASGTSTGVTPSQD